MTEREATVLFVSILTSDRERDPELWAVIWLGGCPPTLKLHQAYNLAGNKRVFIWEGQSAADLQFMDRFNYVGLLETFPAFDRTDIITMQVGMVSKFLLTEVQLRPQPSDNLSGIEHISRFQIASFHGLCL